MKIQIDEWCVLDDSDRCSLTWLCQHSGLAEDEVEFLIEGGIIIAASENEQDRTFPLQALDIARTARRLHDDFELDRHGVVLALTLIQRVHDLQLELTMLRAQLQQQVSSNDNDEKD